MHIRPMDSTRDMDAVIDIWLCASIMAHDFIAASFWQGQVQAMREQYLPHTNNYVWEGEPCSLPLGFYAVSQSHDGAVLQALFVAPQAQGKGIGAQLIAYLKAHTPAPITLYVYQRNMRAIAFYQRHGFTVQREQVDLHTGEPELVMVYRA